MPLKERGMNRVAIKITLLLFLMTLVYCNKTPNQATAQSSGNTAAKRYHLKGTIVSIDKPSKMAIINGEAIPGFMEAMTMPYQVKPESQLDKLAPGDAITADVVVQDDNGWLENIVVTRHAGAAEKGK
jgi:protein SCO1